MAVREIPPSPPPPAKLVVFRAYRVSPRPPHTRVENCLPTAATAPRLGGLTLETFRKDFAYRARLSGAGVDDVNLYQGRQETIIEKHYTTNQWFIVHQCRWWIDKMFGDKPGLQLVQ